MTKRIRTTDAAEVIRKSADAIETVLVKKKIARTRTRTKKMSDHVIENNDPELEINKCKEACPDWDGRTVFVLRTDERLGKDEYEFAVRAIDTDYWLDAFCTYNEARKFCEDNGLEISERL